MTRTPTKTDNSDPQAKLDLRRYFLRTYHTAAPPHVLDCCQGSGLLWRSLRQEFPIASYWGLDQKPKKGRLQIDSVRVLAQPGWRADIIDVDTYGSPWKHWLALLPHVRRPVTVFLTVGATNASLLGGVDRATLQALGLPARTPPTLSANVAAPLACSLHLGRAASHGLSIAEALGAVATSHDRKTYYLGLHLRPSAPP